MEWTRQVDGYCERMGPEYWAEPINALTNLAFVLAAFVMWRRSAGVPMARLLCAILFAIGLGSYLFHTFAQVWAGVADVLPIAVFVIVYLFAVNRDIIGQSPLIAAVTTGAGLVTSSLMVANIEPLMRLLGSSRSYAPVLLLIVVYAMVMGIRRNRSVAVNFAIAASLFAVSLTFRTLDETLCGHVHVGTHFLWHVLNGMLLAWMIELYLRARLGKAQAAR